MFLVLFLAVMPVHAEQYEYDSLDRVTKVIYDDGSFVTYEYDGAGNMIRTEVSEPQPKQPEDTPEEQDPPNGQWIQDVIQQAWETVRDVVTDLFTDILNRIFGW